MQERCIGRSIAPLGAAVIIALAALLAACSSDELERGPSESSCGPASAPRAPLRRLIRVEYNNTARDLLGIDLSPADRFPPEEVTGGFTNNANVLTVSPLLAEKYMEAAEELAGEAVKNLPALLPCDPVLTGEEVCAKQFVERFGRRAYRRPLLASDVERLMRAYSAGRKEASFKSGIELVIGKNGLLPWSYPGDREHFQHTT